MTEKMLGEDPFDIEEFVSDDIFIERIGGTSETFIGSVSESAFDTLDLAAEAYVEEQIAGDRSVSIVSTKSLGEIDMQKIEELNIRNLVGDDDIISVEKVEVKYVPESDSAVYASDGDESNAKVVHVYIIKLPDVWKYYTPAPITGETITKEYYDSVFDAEKYKNCTYTSKIYAITTISYEYGGKTMNFNMGSQVESTVKFADGKIYMSSKTILRDEETFETNTYYTEAYIEEIDGEVVCYINENPDVPNWQETTLTKIGFNKIEELTPFYDGYLDYTYFTKTDYGFDISGENADRYIKETFDIIGLGEQSEENSLIARFYVSDGTLSAIRQDMNMVMDLSMEGIEFFANQRNYSIEVCTDYGTTVVEKPF